MAISSLFLHGNICHGVYWKFIETFPLSNHNIIEPIHESLVLNAYVMNECSYETAHPRLTQ